MYTMNVSSLAVPLSIGGCDEFNQAFTHSSPVRALEHASEPAPILSFELVPDEASLGGDRYYIRIDHGEQHWFYPLQFEGWELPILQQHVWRWCWRLGDGGYPIDLAGIHQKMELLNDRVLLPRMGVTL